jgi:hypothetical protein
MQPCGLEQGAGFFPGMAKLNIDTKNLLRYTYPERNKRRGSLLRGNMGEYSIGTAKEELSILTRAIVNAAPVEEIYLFGSYAYGNADLFDEEKDKPQRARQKLQRRCSFCGTQSLSWNW